jgi:hypothetical protein
VQNYPSGLDSWLVYGPFDLTGASQAQVTFQRWQITEPSADYFSWMASTNGAQFYGYLYSGNTGGWVGETFDLTNVHTLGDLTGEPEVWVLFHAGSNTGIGDKGVFLDKVKIRAHMGAVAAAVGTPEPRSPGAIPASFVLPNN